MYDEDDLLPISALQHLAFCERQWALIHLEGLWDENVLTAEGRQMHERSHADETEARGDIRIARGLRLRSLRLGLTGKADVVEFHRALADNSRAGITLDAADGLWQPLPVEYKRGRPKAGNCDRVQLCSQALCLEEMLGVSISRGVLFYGRTRRRCDVSIDDRLRHETESLVERLHDLTRAQATPPPVYGKQCKNCSLLSFCLPRTAGRRSARGYLQELHERMREGML